MEIAFSERVQKEIGTFESLALEVKYLEKTESYVLELQDDIYVVENDAFVNVAVDKNIAALTGKKL